MAKTQSLAAQSGALQTMQLPAVFQAPAEKVQARKIAPYITFAHPKRADEWGKIAAKLGTPEEGHMYLIESSGISKLEPAKLGWLCHKQYWAEVTAAGDVLRVSYKELPRPYKEHIEAVVLVYFEDRIVPANVCFRSTKCPAAKSLSDALFDASDPSWLDRSPAHKETGIVAQPFMRFFGEVTLGPKRTSRSSGMGYVTTQCTVKPTGIPEWRLLKDFSESAASQEALQAAADRFEQRCAEMKTKALPS